MTKKQVRAFLGLAGYYRRFLPDYAGKVKTDLTQKHLPDSVVWTRECDTAFKDLKEALSSQPILRNPDFQCPFLLQTDASEYAVGAVLSQLDADGYEHPISFFIVGNCYHAKPDMLLSKRNVLLSN